MYANIPLIYVGKQCIDWNLNVEAGYNVLRHTVGLLNDVWEKGQSAQ